MNDTTRESADGLLTLSGWYVAAMREHAAELRRLTTPLITGQKVGLAYAEMRRCERLDQAVCVLAHEAKAILSELRDEFTLAPAQAEELERQRVEYNRVTDEHRLQMEGVQRVWADGEPPQ